MAIDITTARTEVAKLYIAAFNRVPDASGLAFWVNNYVAGADTLASISEKFATSSEYLGMYGLMNESEYVEAIYNNVFGRASDAAGKAFWVGHLTAGTITWGGLMQQIVSGAQNADAAKLTNQATFGVWAAMQGANVTSASTYLASITDEASVTAAQAAVTANADNDLSNDIALTSALNLVNPVKGQTVFADETTLTTGDEVRGDGFFNLDISGTGAANMTIDGQTVYGSDMVTIQSVNNDGALASFTNIIRTSDWTNLDGITIDNSEDSLTLNDLQSAFVPLAITDYADATGLVTFNYDSQKVAAADNIALSVSEVLAGVAMTGGIIEQVTLQINDVAGAESQLASLAFTNDTGDTKATTLEINGGTAGLDFGITAALDVNLDTIAAGDALSNVSLNAVGNTEVMAVTLGAGNDKLNMGNGLTTDTIDGKDGADMVAVDFTDTAIRTPNMTSVETLNAIFSANAEYDASNTTGLTTINLGVGFAPTGKEVETTYRVDKATNVDFNDLKTETNTINIYGNQGSVELDYEARADIAIDFETTTVTPIAGVSVTAADPMTIAAEFDLINVDELTVTNQGKGVATIADGIDLNADTTELTLVTTTQGGDLIIDDLINTTSAIVNGGSLLSVTINAVDGDVIALDTTATSDFLATATALQYYTISAEDADLIIGDVGTVGNANELERISFTMLEDGSLAQGIIDAGTAEVNLFEIVAVDNNTLAGVANASVNVFVDGFVSAQLERLTINAADRGDVEIDDMDTDLETMTLTGSGNVYLTSDAAGAGLQMADAVTVSSFSGTLTITSKDAADVIYGTTQADQFIVNTVGTKYDGNGGTDTITFNTAFTGLADANFVEIENVTLAAGAGGAGVNNVFTQQTESLNITATAAAIFEIFVGQGNDVITLAGDNDVIFFQNVNTSGVTTINGVTGAGTFELTFKAADTVSGAVGAATEFAGAVALTTAGAAYDLSTPVATGTDDVVITSVALDTDVTISTASTGATLLDGLTSDAGAATHIDVDAGGDAFFFITNDGTDSHIWHLDDVDGDTFVEANEITLIAIVDSYVINAAAGVISTLV